MITLDGSHSEGGGSIVRVALALSTLTGKPFRVTDIRKNRPQPGLKNQHVYAINALRDLSGAKCEDGQIGSTSIAFYPGQIKGRTLSVDIKTAGSITLLLQALVLPVLCAQKKVHLKVTGGTDTKWATPIDFFSNVVVPHLRRFGEITIKTLRRGYYPKGGGNVDVIMKGSNEPDAYSLQKQPGLVYIKGVSHASRSLAQSNVAERQAKAAKVVLNALNVPVQIRTEYSNTESPGSGISLWAVFSHDPDEIDLVHPIILGADALGEKGKRADVVGQEAAEKLISEIESGGCVDQWTADQLLPFLAVAGGSVRTSTVTKHTLTNIYVIEKFLDVKFRVDGNIITLSR